MKKNDKVIVVPFQGSGANDVSEKDTGKEGTIVAGGYDGLHGRYYTVDLAGVQKKFLKRELIKIEE